LPERRILSEALREGRRAIDGDRGVEIIKDWQWYPAQNCWALQLRLTPGSDTQLHVPAQTEWFLTAEDRYPRGAVLLWPAKIAGIIRTFWHQSHNSHGKDNQPWNDGRLCLDAPWFTLDRAFHQPTPRSASNLIRWHVRRALDWLRTAERGELLRPGDPWELPAVPSRGKDPAIVVTAENAVTFVKWKGDDTRSGTVMLSRPAANPKLAVVNEFRTCDGDVVLRHNWGSWTADVAPSEEKGLWLRLPSVPVLAPWHTPSTWGELRQVLSAQGIDLDTALRPILARLRDKKNHIILFGFPIPEFEGGDDICMHWHACRIQPLATGKMPGFRPNESTWWQRDRMTTLADTAEIQWLTAENWSVEQLTSRGRLSPKACGRRWLLLGAGALGSALGEMLVRAGIDRLLVADGESLNAGNLVRHTLDLSSVGVSKAFALCHRLNLASPHAMVTYLNGKFHPADPKSRTPIEECDIIVDCTGADAALEDLALFPWSKPRYFVSLSFGMQARRLFCFAAEGFAFPLKEFRDKISPYLEEERAKVGERDFPREALGCWHPIFPARIDDIWLLAATAVKELQRISASTGHFEPELIVYEQQFEDETFVGLRRIRS
jgi:hypothetical protein